MASFTTGPSLLGDIGTLVYNGCKFSPLFVSTLSGKFDNDESNRTVKYTEIELVADGFVTLAGTQSAGSIAPTMATMHQLLSAQGGNLTYTGRGFDIIVNTTVNKDLKWGPKPELIEFHPLGGGLSAKVVWKVTVCIYVRPLGSRNKAPVEFPLWSNKLKGTGLVQFNYDTSVTYGEDYYSTLSMRGTLEIPLTRSTQSDRTVPYTADDLRPVVFSQVMKAIDLSRFRITNRVFDVSRDKRTLTWDVTAVEKPYMDLPPCCSIAYGTYNVKPAMAGHGLAMWTCSLNATYILAGSPRGDPAARRQAYLLFLTLLRLRMVESEKGIVPGVNDKPEAQAPGVLEQISNYFPEKRLIQQLAGLFGPKATPADKKYKNAVPVDFTISEGLYRDSKSVTFGAAWMLSSPFSHILLASGLWKKVAEIDDQGKNLWATSMANVSGVNSWIDNRLDPSLDVIVDFGY